LRGATKGARLGAAQTSEGRGVELAKSAGSSWRRTANASPSSPPTKSAAAPSTTEAAPTEARRAAASKARRPRRSLTTMSRPPEVSRECIRCLARVESDNVISAATESQRLPERASRQLERVVEE